jgi:hypothetical protein
VPRRVLASRIVVVWVTTWAPMPVEALLRHHVMVLWTVLALPVVEVVVVLLIEREGAMVVDI